MATTTEPPIATDCELEIAVARADLLSRAASRGVKPFTSLADFTGDPEVTDNFDVDEFLRLLREERERPSARSLD